MLVSLQPPWQAVEDGQARPTLGPGRVQTLAMCVPGAVQVDTSEGGGQWGTGGMATKLTAARLATAAGCAMAICAAAAPERVAAIVHGERVGTVFRPLPHALRCGPQCLGSG